MTKEIKIFRMYIDTILEIISTEKDIHRSLSHICYDIALFYGGPWAP